MGAVSKSRVCKAIRCAETEQGVSEECMGIMGCMGTLAGCACLGTHITARIS